jgi:heterodisulfide reductase subunit C
MQNEHRNARPFFLLPFTFRIAHSELCIGGSIVMATQALLETPIAPEAEIPQAPQAGKPSLFDELRGTWIAENIPRCFQCGACTGICTVTPLVPEFNPRQFIHLVQINDEEAFLKLAPVVWRCVGCYLCSQICPRQINPAEIVEALGTLVRKRFPERSSANQNAINDAYHEQLLGSGRLHFPKLYAEAKRRTGRFRELFRWVELRTALKMILSARLPRILTLGKPAGWDRLRKVLMARVGHP